MMKSLRLILLTASTVIALASGAQQADPVVTSINSAYAQAKESIKANKRMGNDMVTTIHYYVPGKGRTTETVKFFFYTTQGIFALTPLGEDRTFHYYPLFFITREYNIGDRKYYEEYLFESSDEHLIYASTQHYDEQGKRIDRKFYFKEGNVHAVTGPAATQRIQEDVYYQAMELKHAFDNMVKNPKE